MSGETIKGLVAAHGMLYVRGEDGLYTLKNNGKEPRDWDQAHFSAAPADRPFTDFFFDEIHELVNGSTIHGEDRQELCDAIMAMVTEGLLPAYEDLRAIRLHEDDQRIPVLHRKKHYDDFVISLWRGYKDRMPKVTDLLGYDIGFLFKKEHNFKQELEKFADANKHHLLLDVAEFLPRQRSKWQNELSTFRDHVLEHSKKTVANVERFYQPGWTEMMFLHAWRTAAELIVFLLETRFPPTLSVMHRAADKQWPNHPRLYEVYLCQPVQRRSFTKIVRN